MQVLHGDTTSHFQKCIGFDHYNSSLCFYRVHHEVSWGFAYKEKATTNCYGHKLYVEADTCPSMSKHTLRIVTQRNYDAQHNRLRTTLRLSPG